MTVRPLVIAALALTAFGLAGCTGSTPEASEPAVTASPNASASDDASGASNDCAGVAVVVDAGDLDAADDPSTEACLVVDGPIVAADALAQAGITTEGTDDYGDQVVCRVNGAPAESDTIVADDGTEYHETCQTMPAAFAYWAVWIKPVDGEWAYAQEGLATQQIAPGERLGLFFTLNGEPAQPAS
ncbi:hypothetical protein FLP10_11665 [Agromyces intestinalis]|uniref:Uncharacterized protein n=1 Tax=Agromyces intestinalis TaxID=2592652 RepID=A0A5C1YIQ5_9MICO|nr:hypothetical protein [Agromyces intestinalis]QEO14999.1 hypothetical protein FLP10_11665 [Agromyces intestinalis]